MNKVFIVVFLILSLFGRFVQAQRTIEFEDSKVYTPSVLTPAEVSIPISSVLGTVTDWNGYYSTGSNNFLTLSVLVDFVASDPNNPQTTGTISFNGNSKDCTIPANKSSYSFGTSFAFGLTNTPSALTISFNDFQSFNISKVTYKINGVVYKVVDSNLDPLSFISINPLGSPKDLYSFFDLEKGQLSSLSSFDGLEVQWFYKELPGYELNKSIMESDNSYLYSDSVYFDNQFFSFSNPTIYSFPIAKSGSALVYRLRGFVKRIGEGTKYSSWLYSGVLNNDIYSLKNTCFTSIIGSLDGKTIPSMAIDFSDKSGKKYLFSFKDGNGKLLQSGLLQNLSPNPSSDLIISTPIYDVFDREIGQVMPFVVRKSSFNFIPDLNKLPNNAGNFSSKSTNVNGSDFCALPDFKFYSEIGNEGSMSYYSNNNSLLSASTSYPNFNYTPSDAGTDGAGRPFTLSTFTNDKTGRKRMDFAPGNAYGNQDRSTRYFYSAVFQEELDKYLGSDAGYARFYSKVVTKDPNNLYTLAIKDAKGQVVLSGISGTGENSPYIELDNNIPNSTNTVTLMNGFGKSELPYTQSLVNSQSLLSVPFTFVNPQSSLTFKYTLEPKPFTFSFCRSGEIINSKCYSCEYEFDLLLKNECDNVAQYVGSGIDLKSNPTIENNNCSTVATEFIIPNLQNISVDVGSYTIEKKLTLTEQSIKNAEAQFLSKQFNTCADINSTAGFESECDDSPIPTPNDPTFAESALLTSFLSDVSPGGQYGATRSNYKTTQFDKDKKDVQVFNDQYLSVFNQGFRYSVNEGKTDIVFETTKNKENFKLPYQSLKGIFNSSNSWRDNFLDFTNAPVADNLYLNEFWRFPDYYGVLLEPEVNGVREPIIRPSTEVGGNIQKFSPLIALTNTRIAFDKYYNYLDANGELVTVAVEFRKVNGNWICDDLVNLGSAVLVDLFELEAGVQTITKNVPIKYLKDVNVFLPYWQPSFARSLIKYHPEYHRVYLDPILGILDEKVDILNQSTSLSPNIGQIGSDPYLIFNNNDEMNLRSIGSSYTSGFDLYFKGSEIFSKVGSEIEDIINGPTEYTAFIENYKKVRYLDYSNPLITQELDIWQLFYKSLRTTESFCNGDESAQPYGDISDLTDNFGFVKSLYIKQLLSLKNDLYLFYAKKSNSTTLPCFTTSDNLKLKITQLSGWNCRNQFLNERVTEQKIISSSSPALLFAKLNARGNIDLNIIDKEFQEIASCSTPNYGELPQEVTEHIADLESLRVNHSPTYCAEYINKLIEKLKFRAYVAYYKNCGQCPEVMDLENYANFLLKIDNNNTLSCKDLSRLGKATYDKLRDQLTNMNSLIRTHSYSNPELRIGLQNQATSIASSVLIFKLNEPYSTNLESLYLNKRITEFCCFKWNNVSGTDNSMFTAKIRIIIDNTDPYYVVGGEAVQFRYLDVSGSCEGLFDLKSCEILECTDFIDSDVYKIYSFFSAKLDLPDVQTPIIESNNCTSSVTNYKLDILPNLFSGIDLSGVISNQEAKQLFYKLFRRVCLPNNYWLYTPSIEDDQVIDWRTYDGFLKAFVAEIFEVEGKSTFRIRQTAKVFESENSQATFFNTYNYSLLNNPENWNPPLPTPIGDASMHNRIVLEVRAQYSHNFIDDKFLVPASKPCCNTSHCPTSCLDENSYYPGIYFCSHLSTPEINDCVNPLGDNQFYYYIAGQNCVDCEKTETANIDYGVDQFYSYDKADEGSKIFTSFPAHASSLEDIVNHSNNLNTQSNSDHLNDVKGWLAYFLATNGFSQRNQFFRSDFMFDGYLPIQNFLGTNTVKRLFIEQTDLYKIRTAEGDPITLLSLNYQYGLKSHFIAKIKNGSDFYDLKFILSDDVSVGSQKLMQADRGSFGCSSSGPTCSGTPSDFKTSSCTFNAINLNLFAKEGALVDDFKRNSLYLFEYPIKDVGGKDLFYLRLPSLAYRWSDLVSFEVIESVNQMQFYFNVADASTYIPVIGRFKREFQNSEKEALPILVEQVFFIRVPYEVEGLCVKRFIQSTGLCCPEDIRLPLLDQITDLECTKVEALRIAEELIERQNREAALLVFKEQYIKHCMSQKEKLTMTYSDRLYQTTLYYYDQSGNLVRTVAPQGVKEVKLSEDQEKIDEDRESGVKSVYTKHDYLSTYKFNSIQKQTSESNPDQDRLNLVDYASTGNSPKFVISSATPESVIKYINDRFIVSYDNNSGSGSAVHLSKNAGNTWSKLVLDEPKSYTGYVKIGVAEKYLVFGKNGFLGEFNPSGSNNTVTPISTDIGDVNFVSGYVLELESSPATGYKILLTDDLGSRYLLTKTGDPVNYSVEVLGEEFTLGNKAKIDQLEELNFNLSVTRKSNLSALVQDNNLLIAVTDGLGTENKTLDHGTLGSTIGITNVELDENNRPIVYTNRGGIYSYNSLESDFVRNENYEQDKEVYAIRRLDLFNEFVFYKAENSFEVKVRKTTLRRLRSNTETFRIPFLANLSLLGELKSLITVSDGSSSKLYSYSILTNSISGQPQNSYSLVRYSFDKDLENSETSSPAVSLITIDLPSSLSVENLKVVPLKDGSCFLYVGNYYVYISTISFNSSTTFSFTTIPQIEVPANSPATDPSLYNAKIEASTVIGNGINSKVILLLSYTGTDGDKFRIATLTSDGNFSVANTDLMIEGSAYNPQGEIILKPTSSSNQVSIYNSGNYEEYSKSLISINLNESGELTNSIISYTSNEISGLNLTGSNKSFLVDDFGSVLSFSTDKKEVKYYNGFQIQVNQAAVPTLNAKDLSARFRFSKVNSVSLSKVIVDEVDASNNPTGKKVISGVASANNGYFGIFKNTQTPGVTNNLVNQLRSTTFTIERINNLTTLQTYKVGNIERASSTESWNLTFFTDKSINRVIYNSTGPPPSANGIIHPIADIPNELGSRSLNKLVYKSGSDYLFSTNFGGLLKYNPGVSWPDQAVISSKANQDSKYQFIIPNTVSSSTQLFAFGDNDFRAFSGSNNFNFSEVPLGDFNVKMADVASSPSGSIAVLLEVVNSSEAKIYWSRNNGLQWETRALTSLQSDLGPVGKLIVNDDFSAEVVYPTKIIRIANITASPLITFEVPFNLESSNAIPDVSKVFKYDNNRYIIISNLKVNFLTINSVNVSLATRDIPDGSFLDASMPTRNSLFITTSSHCSKFDISNFIPPVDASNLPIAPQSVLIAIDHDQDASTPRLPYTGISCRFVDDKLGYILASSDNQSAVLKTVDGGETFTQIQKSQTDNVGTALGNNPAKCFDLNGDENLIVRANKVNGSTSEAHILSIKDQSDRITSRFFYDEVGRLILSQNAKQYGNTQHLPRFSYMQYDALGRVTESGQIQFASTRPNGGFPSQDAMRTSIISDAEVAELFKENAGDIKEYVVQTYYDQDAEAIDNTLSLPEFDQNNLQNRVSLVISEQKFAQTDKTFTSYTRYSYDVVGNVNKVDIYYKYDLPGLSNPNLNIHNTIDYVFDELNGKVYSLCFNKGLQGQFYHQYKYDAQGRLQLVQTSVDGKVWVNDAKYYYYPHGPLARVELGHDNVQGLDYYYTLQGWLKGVNSSILNPKNDPGKDGFGSSPFAPDVVGYTLNYYQGDFTPIGTIPASERADLQGVSSLNNTVTTTVGSNTVTTVNGFRSLYNGNIAAMVTAHQGKSAPDARLGIYQYDELNRIKKTQNKILTASLFNNTESASLGTAPWSGNAPYNESFSYDKNGNIETLTRNDEKGALMDNLDYDYLNMNGSISMSNRLGKVKDAASAKPGFADFEGNPTTDVYEYDPSGNLKKDGLEGLEKIVWTPANKMEFIEKMNNDGKRYYYYKVFDGTGQLALKWTTEKTTSGEIAKDGEAYTRDPQGNTLATYKISNTGALTLAEQPIYGAARIGMYSPNLVIAAETPNPLVPEVYPIYGNRSYEISNHLGNVLAVVSDQKDANGKAIIIDKQDYYAFGSPLPKQENVKDETLVEINGTTTTLATQIFRGFRTSQNPVAVISNSSRTFETPLLELQAGYYTYSGEIAGCATLPSIIHFGFNSVDNATQVCSLEGNKFTITFTASEAQRKLFIKVPVSTNCSGEIQLRGLKLTRLQDKTVYYNDFTQPAVNWTYNGGALNVCTTSCTTSVGSIPYRGILIEKNKLLVKRLEGLALNQDYVARIAVKNLPTIPDGTGISILVSDANGDFLETDRKVVGVTNETLVIEVAFRATNTVHQFVYSTSIDFYTIVTSFTLERRKADTKPTTASFTNATATNSILTCAGCAYSEQVGDVKVNTQTDNVVQFNHLVTPRASYNLKFDVSWTDSEPTCTARTLEISTNGGITYTTVAIESGINAVANINFTAPATISYPVLLRFSCTKVILTNINYTVLRSAEIVNDNFRTPDVADINNLGYQYFNGTNTTPSTADLSKETVVVGSEQFKILQIAPSTPTTRLQKVLSGLEIGKTYRVAVILPRTTYNVTHEGTTYPVQNLRLDGNTLQIVSQGLGVFNVEGSFPAAMPGYVLPPTTKVGRGLTPDGNYHYWISFVATAPTATVTYLAPTNNIFPTPITGGFRLKNAGGRQILGFTLHQKIPTEEDGDGDGYRYGFNTQQKQDDIYGPGNHTTALYWEYDTRLGRRWNLDPEVYPNLSRYLVNYDNPFLYSDILGNTPGGEDDKKQKADKGLVNAPTIGQPVNPKIEPSGNNVKPVTGPNGFRNFLKGFGRGFIFCARTGMFVALAILATGDTRRTGESAMAPWDKSRLWELEKMIENGESLDGNDFTDLQRLVKESGKFWLLYKVPNGPLNGINIRNKHLALKNHPVTGVRFDKDGFPDFTPYLYKKGISEVNIELTGNTKEDIKAANKAAGYKTTPEGYAWHHNQYLGLMQLVNAEVHRKTGHTGGAKLNKIKTG